MLVITGGSILTNNTAQYGGELHAIASKMYFSGNHSFKEKQGQFGGGCLLSDSSLAYCSSEEYTNTVRFVSNYAHQYGGAVWVKDIPFCSCYCSSKHNQHMTPTYVVKPLVATALYFCTKYIQKIL